jgi:hypothetical protein
MSSVNDAAEKSTYPPAFSNMARSLQADRQGQ